MTEGILVQKGSAFNRGTAFSAHGEGCEICMELVNWCWKELKRLDGTKTRSMQGNHWAEVGK